MIEIIAFYIAASFLVVSSVGVVVSNNPVRAAMFLILAFFSAASLWILLQAEFLAILLVLVYVGAVMVLFIYVIMIVNIESSPLQQKFKAESSLIWLIGIAIFAELSLILANRYIDSSQMPDVVRHDSSYSNTEQLGMMLFTDYLYPFEIAGILLLLAIVSAIVLIAKDKTTSKFQNPSNQSAVSKSDRLRIVKMSSSHSQAEQSNSSEEKQ